MTEPVTLTTYALLQQFIRSTASTVVGGIVASKLDGKSETTNQLLALINQTLLDGFSGKDVLVEPMKREIKALEALKDRIQKSIEKDSSPLDTEGAFYKQLEGEGALEAFEQGRSTAIRISKSAVSEADTNIEELQSYIKEISEETASKSQSTEEVRLGRGVDLTSLKSSITEALNPLKEAIEQIDLCCCEGYVDKPSGTEKTPSTPAGAQDAGFFVPTVTKDGEGDGPIASVKEIGLAFEDLGNNAQAVFGRMVQSGDMSVKSLLKSFKQLAISSAFNKILPALLGGGDFGGIVSGGLKKVLGFASGGKPPVGVPSLVGERGPELFIPDISGRIMNANNTRGAMAGGGAGVTQNIMFTTDVQNSVRAEILNASPHIANQAAQSVMASMGHIRR